MAAIESLERVVLPPCIEPKRYTVDYVPDLTNFVFRGEEDVEIEIVEETNTIRLNAFELSFRGASYQPKGGKKQEPEEINYHLKSQVLSLVFSSPLAVGEGVLHISFDGTLNNQMAGFYRSGYKSIDGKDKIMASTQFEPIDARRAFPCWDEPDRKATFIISFEVDTGLDVLSNMPETSVSSLPNGRKKIQFMETPKMSTYLLAYCIGEFDFVQDKTKAGVLIRVYTPPGKSEEGKFALSVAVKTLELYDEFFGVPYPLPKLDMIAIPEFACGAMENWGLVTYREVDLLISPTASSGQKQRVCTVVTHELAHQWFGNLVTMKWWDDLWLNEGFASWTQNFAADVIYPDWNMWEQFTTYELASALHLDGLRSSHPIQVPIKHAIEVEEVFDAISYCKGACVVKMLYAVLGHDHFQKGLQNYMAKFQYNNTVTHDLWQAWSHVSGRDISALARSWTETMGYPVVSASFVGDAGADKVKVKLEQRWYLQDGSSLSEEEEKKMWNIPIFIASQGGEGRKLVIMSEKVMEVEVDTKNPKGWVMLNSGQDVPTRILYSEEMRERLKEGIRNKELGVRDRAGLLGDARALIKSGELDVVSFISLLSSYTNEDDCVVWGAISGGLDQLDKILSSDEEIYPLFLKLAQKLVLPAAEKVGWDSKDTDGHLTKMMRGTLISLLSRYASDDPAVHDQARKRFFSFVQDGDKNSLPSEYKVPVFKIVLKRGGEEEFKMLLSRAKTVDDIAERLHCYHSLGATSSGKLKSEVLDFTLSDDIKLQDFFYPMGGVSSSNPEGRDLAFQFFQDRFSDIKAKLATASPSLMNAAIYNCCSNFSSPEKVAEVKAFFAANPLPSSARKIDQLTESLDINAAFFTKVQALKKEIQETLKQVV